MPKTEVILTQHVVGLGGESDQVRVAAGYARNFLLPQGLAIPLTQSNKRRLEALKQKRAEREAKELNSMSELAAALSKLTLVIKMKTGEDGKLFGSVTAGTIADELNTQYEAVLDKKKIHLPQPIKSLGEQEVELRLHSDVTTKLKVRVESTTPAPEPVAAAEPKGKGGKSASAPAKAEAKSEKKDTAPRTEKGAKKK
ncbi:MAG: 50S ribosomal protein L9 [Verrucomicrobiota bacterium]|nr:50S ribosomal protein L9 [Verrucomicrobiota bacterium]